MAGTLKKLFYEAMYRLTSHLFHLFFPFENLSKEFFFWGDISVYLIRSQGLQTSLTKQQECPPQHVAQPLTWSLIGFLTCLGEWFSVTELQT